ncbi:MULTISPECIES: M20/M25/M40 family metallo-hydrolase [unclassified Peribacillus]|uniref:M20/M25/M40 family metallo-hydrolase n=1 Tax=unclassified Peribacillus TaxID=2675266 RepID=UPI001914B798|nr:MULTISPECIES: M20/M25/M40 family metallo-hydrolase [unclassified Peribacillus]MBK5446230.1 M20/M25/M40 family metallo-hydrolase [Peribacillus sp. TH24]MBK5459101.1 M20/M25/M40 family metallo-hydrolase [Peribacillus sp. TH27]
MSHLLWGSKETLRNLLCELVSWDSRTLTDGERNFAYRLRDKLYEIEYFQQNPNYVSLHEVDLGRNYVTAFYRNPKVKDTVVLISHFDTVQTEEYGDLEPLAFYPEELTKALRTRKAELPNEACDDLESGEYLFGRGTMDMKMGLALHMSIIEKAIFEQWPLNLILLTVPDEEVNSSGMRAAVSRLVQMRDEYDLFYKLFLNGEPSFSQKPGDSKSYIYSGTMGKIMPAALFYGKETHVGEPFKGITAPYISSFLTQLMEWNALFREKDLGETTPLPIVLQQKDLKSQYSTQTPYRSVALYNVFVMKRSASDIMNLFEKVAQEAAAACNASYKTLCQREQLNGVGEIQVLRYEKLIVYAEQKLGKRLVEEIKNEVKANFHWDEREKSLRIADKLLIQCQELAPAIVILFAPPYYPPVNTSHDPLIIDSIKKIKKMANKISMEINHIHYFNGVCDLSYVHYNNHDDGWSAFERNTPVWGKTYNIPFKDMMKLQAPVFNVGPFGKDAHQRTERLHIESAFVQTPMMIECLLKNMFTDANTI